MPRLRLAAILLAGWAGVLAPAAKASDGKDWLELMSRMARAFTAMTGETTSPRSSVPDLTRRNLFGRPPNLLGLRPGDAPFTTAPGYLASPPYSPTRLLDGIWETHTGAILLVHVGRARLYLNRQTSQDFDLRLDSQTIVLRDRQYGSLRRYAYATRDGRLVMQDTDGNLLLLRRVSASGAG